MVTKPTGNPRGRPRKSDKTVSEPKVGSRKPLKTHSARYMLAFMQASILQGVKNGVSGRKVLDIVSAAKYGIPLDEMHGELLHAGGGGYLRFDKDNYPLRGEMPQGYEKDLSLTGKNYDNRNAFRPYAGGIKNKLDKIIDQDMQHPDRVWLDAMVRAWCVCLDGLAEEWPRAAFWACFVEEGCYFDQVMLPILWHQYRCRLYPEKVKQLVITDLIFSPIF